ncbi:GGDEF domain-containing protein [Piscinibacter aquaticus]|uniref:GGDEF domain-containing protein n=1 Tax=Piscinibacter aquaticus TaxID=392597 RepID=A0A5C6U1A8_9BURK|nr:GGDEF domain-containing protein [Piscinibacter aquaticus]
MNAQLSAFLLRLIALSTALLLSAAAQAAPALLIDGSSQRVEAWPSVTILPDESGETDITAAMAAADRFEPPRSAYATLGLRKEPVWLRIPIRWTGGGGPTWMLDIDYSPLNRVDAFLVREGRIVQQARLGNMQPFDQRPIPSRSHALPLELKPDVAYELYLRVQTQGAMILPITVMRPQVFHTEAMDEHILQGLLAGLGLCLVLYSLVQWWSTRESMFVKYAMLTSGSLMFSVVQFGVAGMYLWRDNLYLESHGAPLMALLAAGSTFLFVEEVLRGPGVSRYFTRIMYAGAAALFLTALLYALDVIHVHSVSRVIGTLGLLPALMGLPGAITRARRGDAIGWYFLVALARLLHLHRDHGRRDPGLHRRHAVDAACLPGRCHAGHGAVHARARPAHEGDPQRGAQRGARARHLRLDGPHRSVDRPAQPARPGRSARRRDGEQLARAPAGGLHDRSRRFQAGQRPAWPRARRRAADRSGPAAGSQLRSSDVVARLGGDEFVVTAAGLADERQARDLGHKLVEAFREPFVLAGQRQCQVGLTIGYVLVPVDGTDPVNLLRRADAAMYAGKQGGKGCVRRAETVAA